MADVSEFPPPGSTFDPDSIKKLCAAYEKAVDGQPTSVREMIAKHIIALAAEGERDSDKLCEAALARLDLDLVWFLLRKAK
jgi:hypothetical protein